ncbi:type II toxin-antitoxin system MqsA family antitoxin [Massilia sp. Dwa41.01b]|uniref:type II toxin-antitoxin system MqsA family antitoxin n=1 Tax=unclassified Massilia TaxID=2609279 RepID=UPI001602DE3F|nr:MULTISPECIES: type II toxin-antitoxin system MqsA family antitoxin [unclassified Massilia]QNA90532.1 type II toxin-antitoxin system MqsA family antitoxin [Massilia sp. Dwa41.01b]QNA97763.1 type II toxin-antitoxin system MqsA family antitoxin [Massilia sp. Se16.2.3]
MKCPFCESTDLVHDLRDLPYAYKGSATTFEGIEGHFCRGCREGILTPRALGQFGQLAMEFRRKVDAGVG